MANSLELPEGFVLEQGHESLPKGFVLEQKSSPQINKQSINPDQSNSALEEQKKPQISQIETVLREGGQGAGFGFTDKIGSAVAAGIAKAYGQLTKDKGYNAPFSELYNEAYNANKEREKLAEEQHPITSIASEIAGSLGSGGEILKGLGLTGNSLKNIAGGSVALGGISAAGNSEKLSDVAGNVAESAPESLAIGLLTHGAIKSGSKAFDVIKNALGFKPEETSIIAKIFTPEEAIKAASILQDQIAKGELPNLLNTGDPKIDAKAAKLATKLIKSNKEGGIDFNEGLKAKTAQNTSDVENTLESTRKEMGNYFKNIADLDTKKQIEATPYRLEAYEQGKYIPTLQDIELASHTPSEYLKNINTPKIPQNELSQSQRIQDLKSNPDFLSTKNQKLASDYNEIITDPRIKTYVSRSIKDNEIKAPINSTEMLHDVRKQITSDINGYQDSVNNGKSKGENTASTQSELHGLEALKNRLNKVIYEVSPAMKQHDKIYTDASATKRAYILGRNYDSFKSPEEFATKVEQVKKNGSLTDIDAVKNGVVQKLLDNTLTGKNSNPAKNILSSEENKRALKQVFSDPEELKQVTNKLEKQATYADTIGKVIAKNPANLSPEDEAHFAALSIMNPKSISGISPIKIVNSLANFLNNKYGDFNDKNSKELAKTLLDPNRSVDKLLETAKKGKTGVRQAIKDLLPAVLAAKIGGVYTQNNNIPSQ